MHHKSYLLETELWLPLFLSLLVVVAVSGLVVVVAKKRMLLQQQDFYRKSLSLFIICFS